MTVTRSLNENLLIASCAASAGIHAGLAPTHLAESPALGLSFLCAAVALIAIALALSVGSPGLAPAGAVLMALLMAGYAISRTVGLPFGGEGVEEWDVLGLLTQCIQVVGLGAALLVHYERRHQHEAASIPGLESRVRNSGGADCSRRSSLGVRRD
jgi:hypothetical protein